MPHSSGGGSHSGGSHSSSHSSHGSSHSSFGSSGRGSSYRTSSSYFPGAYRYVRYHNGKADYIYSEDGALTTGLHARYILLLIYIPFYFAVFLLFSQSINIPEKITATYQEQVRFEDNLGVLDKDLGNILVDFYKKTGIPVTVITRRNGVWKPYYDDLKTYAYEQYVKRYYDEDHWLIVYTTDNEDGFEDWYFEGIQGDNTDSILTFEKANKWNSALTRYLMTDQFTVSEAIGKSISDMTPTIMQATIQWDAIPFGVGIFVFISIHMYFMVFFDSNKKKYKGYTRCPVDTKDTQDPHANEATCEYCGGIYYKGTVTSCPHCSAPIKSKNN